MCDKRRSQDFLRGCTYFPQKVNDLFLVVAIKTEAKSTKLTIPTVQMPPISKKGLLLCLGCTLCLGVHLLFPINLPPPNFISPPWGCTCPLAMPMMCDYQTPTLDVWEMCKLDFGKHVGLHNIFKHVCKKWNHIAYAFVLALPDIGGCVVCLVNFACYICDGLAWKMVEAGITLLMLVMDCICMWFCIFWWCFSWTSAQNWCLGSKIADPYNALPQF